MTHVDSGNMNGIALYCNDACGGVLVVVVVWYLLYSNTTPGYTTLVNLALDCGNMYGIALYCKRNMGWLRRLCIYVAEAMHWYFWTIIPLQVIQLCSALPWIVATCIYPSNQNLCLLLISKTCVLPLITKACAYQITIIKIIIIISALFV